MNFGWDQLPLDQQLVGLVMNNPPMLHKLLEAKVCEEFFHDGFARLVFQTMVNATCKGVAITERNIGSLLGEKHAASFLELELNAPVSVNLEYFLEPFLENHAARAVEKNNATHRQLSTMELQRLNSETVAEIMAGLNEAKTIGDIADDWEKAIDAHLTGKVVYLPTHIKALNELITGWMPGGLYILGARPKIGKTTLAMNFAYHLVDDLDARIVFGTIEMSSRQVFGAFVARHARVERLKILRKTLSEAETDRLYKAKNQLKQTKLDIVDNWEGRWDLLEPRLESAMKERHPPELIILDHLHIMRPDAKTPQGSLEGITRLTGSIKVFAQTWNVPVLLCSQFNRESDKESRPPRMSDLRGSGSIEQDADVVMLLHQAGEHGPRELFVAANRHGSPGRVPLGGNMAIAELKGDEL